MSVLTSRKSSSTPSLNEVNDNKPSVAATEQASSADNLTQTVKSVGVKYYLHSFIHYNKDELQNRNRKKNP